MDQLNIFDLLCQSTFKNEATEAIMVTFSKYKYESKKEKELFKILDSHVNMDALYSKYGKLHLIICIKSLVEMIEKNDRKSLDVFEDINIEIMRSLGLLTEKTYYKKMIDEYLDESNEQKCFLVFVFNNKDIHSYRKKDDLERYIDLLKIQTIAINDIENNALKIKPSLDDIEILEKRIWENGA